MVVGDAHQELDRATPRTYLGPGSWCALPQLPAAETVIFVRPVPPTLGASLLHHAPGRARPQPSEVASRIPFISITLLLQGCSLLSCRASRCFLPW